MQLTTLEMRAWAEFSPVARIFIEIIEKILHVEHMHEVLQVQPYDRIKIKAFCSRISYSPVFGKGKTELSRSCMLYLMQTHTADDRHTLKRLVFSIFADSASFIFIW